MTGPGLVLSVDVGTTNVKAAVVDPTGHLLHIAHREMSIEQGEDGRAEHDPDALFEAFVATMLEASTGYEERISLVVPATYQMGLIAIDGQDAPLTGLMTLLDTRARQSHAEMLDIIPGPDLYERTGCPPAFHYPLAKLYWLKSRRPETYQRTHRFLSSKDYLLRRLTGTKAADISVSSTTQYMNIKSLAWDDHILNTLGISTHLLPSPMPPEHLITHGLDAARQQLKLPNMEGILLGAYDGGAVGIGLGAMDSETAVMNFGTTAMLRYGADHPALSADGSMAIQSSFLAAGKWIPGGAINNAGAVLRWLRDEVFDSDFETLTAAAKSTLDSRGLMFLPYLSGERSIDIGPNSSGSYFGLRTYHDRGHLVRAAFEGVAFSLRRVRDALHKTGYIPKSIRVGSGGSHSPVWMQILASVLNLPLETVRASEPGLMGSAMLGYVALNDFPDLSAATRAMVRTDHTFQPDADDAVKYSAGYEQFNFLTEQMRAFDIRFSQM